VLAPGVTLRYFLLRLTLGDSYEWCTHLNVIMVILSENKKFFPKSVDELKKIIKPSWSLFGFCWVDCSKFDTAPFFDH
jgi:hypothetical protein